jgi:hypothetical protein
MSVWRRLFPRMQQIKEERFLTRHIQEQNEVRAEEDRAVQH